MSDFNGKMVNSDVNSLRLPQEIWALILGHDQILSRLDLFSAALVSKNLNRLATQALYLNLNLGSVQSSNSAIVNICETLQRFKSLDTPLRVNSLQLPNEFWDDAPNTDGVDSTPSRSGPQKANVKNFSALLNILQPLGCLRKVSPITDSVFLSLSNIALTELNLGCIKHPATIPFENYICWPNLQKLSLSEDTFELLDSSKIRLGKNSLKTFCVSDSSITDRKFISIIKDQSLERLELVECNELTTFSISTVIKTQGNLRFLYLHFNDAIDFAFDDAINAVGPEELVAADLRIIIVPWRKSAVSLHRFPKLAWVHLFAKPDEGFEPVTFHDEDLQAFPSSIRVLIVDEIALPLEAVFKSLPNLFALNITCIKPSYSHVPSLLGQKPSNIRILHINDCVGANDACLDLISRYCPFIEEISMLQKTPQYTLSGLQKLVSGCNKIQALGINMGFNSHTHTDEIGATLDCLLGLNKTLKTLHSEIKGRYMDFNAAKQFPLIKLCSLVSNIAQLKIGLEFQYGPGVVTAGIDDDDEVEGQLPPNWDISNSALSDIVLRHLSTHFGSLKTLELEIGTLIGSSAIKDILTNAKQLRGLTLHESWPRRSRFDDDFNDELRKRFSEVTRGDGTYGPKCFGYFDYRLI